MSACPSSDRSSALGWLAPTLGDSTKYILVRDVTRSCRKRCNALSRVLELHCRKLSPERREHDLATPLPQVTGSLLQPSFKPLIQGNCQKGSHRFLADG